jgi:hypothetical protein
MPEKRVRNRARKDKAEGKAASTQAGEFVREEIHHIREGKHGARSAKQAIAIGLAKARRSGVDLPPPEPGKTSDAARRSAARANEQGHESPPRRPSRRRSRSTTEALEREGHAAASHVALSRQARRAAARRSSSERSAAARKAAATKSRAAG